MRELESKIKSPPKCTPAKSVNVKGLRLGMVHAARLVRRYGMIYWPIVERLQREIDEIERRETLLKKLLNED